MQIRSKTQNGLRGSRLRRTGIEPVPEASAKCLGSFNSTTKLSVPVVIGRVIVNQSKITPKADVTSVNLISYKTLVGQCRSGYVRWLFCLGCYVDMHLLCDVYLRMIHVKKFAKLSFSFVRWDAKVAVYIISLCLQSQWSSLDSMSRPEFRKPCEDHYMWHRSRNLAVCWMVPPHASFTSVHSQFYP